MSGVEHKSRANKSFTTGFVSGLLAQKKPQPQPPAPSNRGYGRSAETRKRQMLAAIERHNADPGSILPYIRMYVSPWVKDENGIPTRIVRQLDDRFDHRREDLA